MLEGIKSSEKASRTTQPLVGPVSCGHFNQLITCLVDYLFSPHLTLANDVDINFAPCHIACVSILFSLVCIIFLLAG